jgi:phosphatidylcholine synthase
MVVLVLFAIDPPPAVVLATVVALTVAMFLNLKFVHPTRTLRWHQLNLGMAILWLVCAALAAWADFNEGLVVHWGLILSSLYLCFAGIVQEIFPERPSHRIA